MARQHFLDGYYIGKLGQTIGSTWHGKPYVKAYAVPNNPKTPAQQANRAKFAQSIRAAQIGLNLTGKQGYFDTTDRSEFQSRTSFALENLRSSKTILDAVYLTPEPAPNKSKELVTWIQHTNNKDIQILSTNFMTEREQKYYIVGVVSQDISPGEAKLDGFSSKMTKSIENAGLIKSETVNGSSEITKNAYLKTVSYIGYPQNNILPSVYQESITVSYQRRYSIYYVMSFLYDQWEQTEDISMMEEYIDWFNQMLDKAKNDGTSPETSQILMEKNEGNCPVVNVLLDYDKSKDVITQTANIKTNKSTSYVVPVIYIAYQTTPKSFPVCKCLTDFWTIPPNTTNFQQKIDAESPPGYKPTAISITPFSNLPASSWSSKTYQKIL